jgi:ribosomal protein L31
MAASKAVKKAAETAAAAGSKQIFARQYRPPVFKQTVVMSDGASYQRYTTSPRDVFRLSKDIRNAQLWNPDMGKRLSNEESGRMARFANRFSGFGASTDNTAAAASSGKSQSQRKQQQDEVDDLDWMVDANSRAAPKMSERELRESTRKKPAKGKK